MSGKYQVHPMEQAFRDWDAKDKQFQRELNIHICRRWDELIAEGKHGHYESLLSVCRSAISFWRNRAETESQASADSIRDGLALAKQQREQIAMLREALEQAERGLRGKYPWHVYAKYSQTEARKVALECVQSALARAALAATEGA